MDKRSLSERDICTKFIMPALRKAGWDEMSQIREAFSFTNGGFRKSGGFGCLNEAAYPAPPLSMSSAGLAVSAVPLERSPLLRKLGRLFQGFTCG